MSSGLMMSLISTIEETETLPSLMPPSPPMCEWQSMMPGMTYCPPASITVAPAGSITFSPTAAIFPLVTTMEPCLIVPWVTVMIVAFRMTMLWAQSAAADAAAARMRRFILVHSSHVGGGVLLPVDDDHFNSGAGLEQV